MGIYIFLTFIVILCSGNYIYKGRHVDKDVSLIGALSMIVISILRFDVGFDYQSYYNLVFPFFDSIAIERYEPAPRLITIISYYFRQPHLQFIIYGIITYFFTFKCLWKYSDNFGISCIIYLSFFYLDSLGIIRQAAAVAIVLYSYKYIVSKKFIAYFLCVLLAMMFHLSAIISIIFYPLINLVRLKTLWILIIAGIITTGFALSIILTYPLFEDYAYSLKYAEIYQGGNFTKYLNLLLGCAMIIFSYRNKETLALKFSIISLLGLVFPFYVGGHLGGRVVDYFLVFYCLTVPMVLRHYRLSTRRIVCEILGCYFLMGVFISTGNPTKQPYTPYQCILMINQKSPKFKS